MTKEIVIKNPSPEFIKFFDGLREKKQQQIEKLKKMHADGEKCIFTVRV